MTQELFWLFSSINFICMAVFTVINILLTRKLSMRSNDLSKKTGIDLSIHKDLMNIISDFLNSITENKVRLLSGEEFRDNIMIEVKNNSADMKRCCIKLSLFLEYSFTDSEAFKKALCAMSEKYSKIYDSLLEALYWDKRCQAYGNDADAIEQRIKLTEKMNGYYHDYYALLGDEKTDKIFFEELDRFIKKEISYIKERNS